MIPARARLVALAPLAVGELVGMAASAVALLATSPGLSVPLGAAIGDAPPAAAVADTRAATPDAVLAERVDRAGDVARAETRQQSRHDRVPPPALAAIAAVLATTALSIALARRHAGRTAVMVGGVAPARAPPSALACT